MVLSGELRRSLVARCRLHSGFSGTTLQEAQLVVCPLVSHLQGLPRLYGVPKSQSLSPVYRTRMSHDKQGLCAARQQEPSIISQFVTKETSGMPRAHLAPQIPGCMHAGG